MALCPGSMANWDGLCSPARRAVRPNWLRSRRRDGSETLATTPLRAVRRQIAFIPYRATLLPRPAA